MTHAELMEQRDALLKALGTGARRVEFRDRVVEYHSINAIQDAINRIDREIAANSGRRVHTFLPTFQKGL
jgi:hypothetical protein